MKKLHYKYLFLLIFFCIIFQQKSIGQNFVQLPSGISYAILQKGTTGEKLAYDKFVNFHIEVKTELGKVLTSTFANKNPQKFMPVKPKQFEGDPFEIFPFLAKGDSAVCKMPIEIFAKRVTGGNIEQLKGFVGNSKFILYTFKILDVLDKQQAEIAKKQELAKQREKFEAQQKAEDGKIQVYLKKNSLIAQKTPSGLYYIIKKKAEGELNKVGESVKVHYVGQLLNGKIFDTSREEVAKANGLYNSSRDYNGFSFPLGKGRVIKGWDEGVALMSKGSRYLFIIPSHLGYGKRGAGARIPPNSILIFDVESL